MLRVLLVAAALIAFPASVAVAHPHARVFVADRAPLTIRGTGFASREHVTVTVRGGVRAVRQVTTSTAGRFLVRIVVSPKMGCLAVELWAVGSRGTTAFAKVPGLECPQGPVDPGQ